MTGPSSQHLKLFWRFTDSREWYSGGWRDGRRSMTDASDQLPPWLAMLLACPVCRGKLRPHANALACRHCQRQFPIQEHGARVDFFPRDLFMKSDRTEWESRQRFFGDWLTTVMEGNQPTGDEEFFSACVRNAGPLGREILDVGGGDGYLAHWLPPDARYVCVDPEDYELPIERSCAISARRLNLKQPLIMRGVGEYLPFGSETFAGVFCLGTLNHTSRPGQVLREIHRVLLPGGCLVLSLEEIPLFLPLRNLAGWRVVRIALASARAKWLTRLRTPTRTSVQPDHILVPPSQVTHWLKRDFRLDKTFFVACRGVVEMGQRWIKRTTPARES